MHKFRAWPKAGRFAAVAGIMGLILLAGGAHRLRAQSSTAGSLGDAELIVQFRRVEVASVSDALEQITGKKMYMTHRVQPIYTAKFAGFARTVRPGFCEGLNGKRRRRARPRWLCWMARVRRRPGF